MDPESQRQQFVLPDGFEIQLVAAEPDIAKPMNMAFDSRRRLWVSSSTEYPYAAPNDRPGKDTIKILEDTTGDGRADKITTFADDLNIPIGLYPYRDGVICFSIPNILFIRDLDGDGRADRREVLYGPMDTSRDTHGMCNAFTRGFDGWLYACHGFNNETTVSGRDGNEVVMHSGNTFRMRLDGSRIEHFTYGQVNPFGMAFRPDGDLFTADCHTKPITLLMQGGYSPSFGKPHDGVGFVPPVMEHLHGSTAIGGIALYHAEQFPEVFRGNAFHGNVMTSRVNRNSLRHVGSSVRAEEEPDFLISSDPWFRPVDLQVGPDGALYIADFYNRIIGHYEVPLTHPGRDRHRGRIWRVVFTGNDDRRDVPADFGKTTLAVQNRKHHNPTLKEALQDLSSTNLSRRMSAGDVLADQFGESAVFPIREQLRQSTMPDEIVQLTWVLFRLDAIEQADVMQLVESDDALLRNHAYRIISEMPELSESYLDAMDQGLGDADPLVRRSAVMATKSHPRQRFASQLLEMLHKTTQADVHLRHAIRMSLRDHFTRREWLEMAMSDPSGEDVEAIAEICLAVKTPTAANFVVENLRVLDSTDAVRFAEYLSFAARYASRKDLATIAKTAKERFRENFVFQEQLIRSVRDGIDQRGDSIDPVVAQWATDLAAKRLDVDPNNLNAPISISEAPIAWTFIPDPANADSDNPWSTSDRRSSADGRQRTRLHSSFPKGEQRTGIYRSGEFVLPHEFRFYLAGHDGFPDQPLQQKNWVRVRDAISGRILKQWSPPRNDVAQQVRWQTDDHRGKPVYVELVDGDDGRAYAWLAAGRFCVEGLNPSEATENWREGAKLVAEFGLELLRPVLVERLSREKLDPATSVSFATAILAGKSENASPALDAALAQSLGVPGVVGELRANVVQEIVRADKDSNAANALVDVLSVANADDQRRLAVILAGDQRGTHVLLKSVQLGRVSASFLLDPQVSDKLTAVANSEQRKTIESLSESLPAHDERLQRRLDQKMKVLLSNLGDVTLGEKVFAAHCGVCHQVAGKGQMVGPNLDGIGNRGITRLSEDVFLPNQNVDVAFRASLILTDDGAVHSGLIKRTEGAQLVLVDGQGKEKSISTQSIERQTKTVSSPMPANFAETLSDADARHLFAYLLSLR
ncbi:MAG: c-type cytochrome [Pirellulaceae bacterium]|nr:c-type cytochrome [Pirellulaceae bacterium]